MDHHPQDGSQGRAQDAHSDHATTASREGSSGAAGRRAVTFEVAVE
ncbi:MAG: hypothetical protein QM519_04180 [Bacteroidia bacterium]|nr:hypothetical protein [Bacteroidia bacterium]